MDKDELVTLLRDKTHLIRFSASEVRDVLDRMGELGFEVVKKEEPQEPAYNALHATLRKQEPPELLTGTNFNMPAERNAKPEGEEALHD